MPLPPPAVGTISPFAPSEGPASTTEPAPGSVSADPALAQVLQPILDDWRTETGAPGAVLAVRLDDGRTSAVASGRTDDGGGDPVEPTDRFRIGSITKTYVATLIMQLAEEGRLALDDLLAVSLPQVSHADEVTIAQLLGHTSGIADFGSLPAYRRRLLEDPGRTWAADEVVELVADRPLDFEPGERWAYSNTNYILLGMVAEAITGKALANLLHDRILEPLDLTSTYLEKLEEAPRLAVAGHFDLDGDGQSENVRLVPYTALVTSGAAAGGLSASALDVLEFADALMSGRLVGRDSLARMMEVSPDSVSASSAYGLGLMRFQSGDRVAWGHAGGLPGFSALVAHSVDDDLTIVALANESEVDVSGLAERVGDAADGL